MLYKFSFTEWMTRMEMLLGMQLDYTKWVAYFYWWYNGYSPKFGIFIYRRNTYICDFTYSVARIDNGK